MPSSLIALQIFLILLPGFASAYVVQFLVTRRPQTDLERIIEALLYSFVIYVIFSALNGGRLPFHVVKDSAGKEDTILWESGGLGLLALVTFVFSFLVTAYFKHDGNRIFRLFDTEDPALLRRFGWLKFTERTTRNSIWNDIFESEYLEGQYVQVELADGRNLLGVIQYYSDASEDSSLYLTDASWLPAEGEEIPIHGGGILLTKGCGIRSISLLDSDREIDDGSDSSPQVADDDEETRT